MRYMKQVFLAALLALLLLTPARAQMNFSDSLRISLLTCSPGPDAYERFGHAGLRIEDLRNPQLDVTFHYGVFSFNAPHFIYRFVKGETDYQLGAVFTKYFIGEYEERGLGMTQQTLNLDSAQCQEMLHRLLINYLPENRTYRYSYFFDNCSTRPYHLINASAANTINYDTTWVKVQTLRDLVQEKTHRGNWLDFGIALAVAGRADEQASFVEQLFLPDHLSEAVANAQIPQRVGEAMWYVPLANDTETLLKMRRDVADAIEAPDPVKPATVFAIVLLLGLLLSGAIWKSHTDHHGQGPTSAWRIAGNAYDTVLLLATGLTGCIVWFLNFCSLHPAVDHNLNCLWLLPTHVILAILIWVSKLQKVCHIYFGITIALIVVYVLCDWMGQQYCPPSFLLLQATLLLRCSTRLLTRQR